MPLSDHAAKRRTRRSALLFVFCASALTLAACQDANNAPAPTDDYQGCLDDGSCVCESSAECPEGQSCDAGQCVADAGCQSGADCAAGEVCEGGACVPEVIPDGDRDGDGIPDIHDTCANIPNPDQLDLDGDGRGDVCDGDIDGDGLVNGADNCRMTFNPMQEDPDGDGLGLACVGGDRAQPFSLPLGVALQRLDTRTRQDDFSGSCGGEGAPDVVYSAPLREGETVRATIEADHEVVIQVVGPGGSEAGCEAGGSLSFTAPTTGTFLFVVDGAGNEDAGLVTVQASVFRDPAGAQSDDYATNSAGAVWVGHVNDDAALDVVSADPGLATVSVRLGAQDGSLGDPIAFRVNGNPAAVWGGDLNNDDAPDLAVVLDDQDVVAVLFNNSEGRAVSFESPQTFAVGADPAAVWGGDLNNSGAPDLVVANSADGTVSVLINDDQGGFAAAQNLDVGEGPVAVWGGDLNNSGAPDLVVANADGGVGTTASVLMNDGAGGFGTAAAIDTGQGPVGVWGGDLNNDGAPDLAIAHDGATVGGLVSIFAGRGDGTFEAPTSHAIGEGPVAVWGGDLNNDGAPDLVSANAGDNSLSMLLGDGQGGFGDAISAAVGGAPTYVWGGDLNNDGVPELMVPNGDSSLSVLGSDADAMTAPMGFGGEGFEGVWGGDLNNDGAPDLAIVQAEAGAVSVRMGMGDGSFGDAQSIGVGEQPLGVWGGDLNNDGVPELAVANRGNIGDTSGTVSLLVGFGDGTFADPTFLTTDLGARSITGDRDFDNDGIKDLAVATFDSDSISLLLASGPGEFNDGHISLEAGDGPVSVWGGDLNNDGAPDLAVSSIGDNVITTHVGDGDGNFAFGNTIDVQGVMPMSLWGDDIDGDGTIDLATANAMSGTLSLIRGQNGGFAPVETFETGGGRGTVWGGDLTGEGQPDLAVSGQDGLRLFTGYTDGSFSGEQRFDIGDGAVWVWGEDFNGDGIADLATTRPDAFEVRLSRLGSPRLAPGARFAQADLPPCAATELQGRVEVRLGEVLFDATAFPEPCRIDRLEMDVEYAAEDETGLLFTLEATHSGSRATLGESFRAPLAPGLWRPEAVSGLARFEGSPGRGLWRLKVTSAHCLRTDGACRPSVTRGVLHINTAPVDPLGTQGGAAICASATDQPDTLDTICRWDTEAIDAIFDRAEDVDLLLLARGEEGGFEAGEVVTVTVEGDPDSPAPKVELLAFGAHRPLARAIESAPGQWALSFEVTEAYAGRYLMVQASATGGILPQTVTIEATID